MTVDELIAELDARFPKWELWRTADKEWACRSAVGDPVQGAASLELALKSLLYYKPLPRIPRRPTLLTLDMFEVKKLDGKWAIECQHRPYFWNIETRKKAMAIADQAVEHSSKRCADWANKYSEIVASGKEGIDFIWED